MGSKNAQFVDSAVVSSEIRRSVHAQLFELGQRQREVARRYGMTDHEAVQIAVQVEKVLEERRLRAAFADGRRSLLAGYARKAGLN